MNDFIYFISKKIKSCNAKRGTTMKMASRLIDLISRKTNCTCSALFLLISKKQICTCSTLFLLISKKTNLHVQHAFFVFPLPFFCTTTTLFCTTETSKFLVTHYFYGELLYVLTQHFVSSVHVRFYFSLPLISPCWPQAFLIFLPPL